ncbi:MAG: DUF4214 domain-containing protein [Clostridiales bacterium]|nr:DUF4214 domain-containing protein [Clostridiales bacterium]
MKRLVKAVSTVLACTFAITFAPSTGFAEKTARAEDTVLLKNDSESEETESEDEDIYAEASIIDAFINDERWKSGTYWGDDQHPKMSTYPGSGCHSYCVDYVFYCFQAAGWSTGELFTSTDEIRRGDVLHVSAGESGNHWVVVLERDGNKLKTAEGNWSDKVRIGWNYTIVGNSISNTGSNYTYIRQLVEGFHYLAAGKDKEATVTPTPAEGVTPTPGEGVTPTPEEGVTPTPGGEVTPTPEGGVTPTPAEGETPAPTSEVSPTPSPTPTEAPTFDDFVERLYNIALARDSEKEGKEFWVGKVESLEFTGADCARYFLLEAPEFMERNLSESVFVETLYMTFFARASEAKGKKYWLDELAKGTPREEIVNQFIDSTEWCNICAAYGIKSGAPNAKAETASKDVVDFATRLYTCCLGRDPEEDGLAYWSKALMNKERTGAEAAKLFFQSEEFDNFDTSNTEFVTRLYRTFMDREPEEKGLKYWVSQLDEGASRQSVMAGFCDSEEFTNICEKYGIERGKIDADKYAYTIDITWENVLDPEGKPIKPQFVIFNTKTGNETENRAKLAEESADGKSTVKLGLTCSTGNQFCLQIDTFAPSTGSNYSFTSAKATVHNNVSGEDYSLDLEKWAHIRGKTGAWYYDVCLISESEVKAVAAETSASETGATESKKTENA